MSSVAHTLTVELGRRSYPILIGDGVLSDGALLARHVPARDLLVVSNTTVAPLYLDALERALSPRRVVATLLPDGESYKTLDTVARILDVLVANRFGRDCVVVALGGGVVGDMAGFAASVYQRGVAFVQVPTTLLAQVDSAVGGKTGVNHPGGKNLIGAFHQPTAVLADTATLATLPPRELRAGLAEVIKYGLIRDAQFFAWLEAQTEALLAGDRDALAHAILRSCQIKAEIVGRDEFEHGERALLNFGHTFGHAIEAASGYGRWLHGEAVAAGMVMAARMSCESGLIDAATLARISALIERMGLPTRVEGVSAEAMLQGMRMDKKVLEGQIRLVLLRGIGEAFVTAEYDPQRLKRTLDAHLC
ncbi:MAG: 3-dehydroquinate synthase [Pseudomonadota bacterium]|jgi:3-dehydroquinate synthase|nr:3-dehydroquinate synthase [Pseudomonadota bacterium]